MSVAVVTGACGLVGSECVRRFLDLGYQVVGVDNNSRGDFFGPEASTDGKRCKQRGYSHHRMDVRDAESMDTVFTMYGKDVTVVVHAAAQPSHDWAADHPSIDFSVNAQGTVNILEAARKHCPEASFVYLSTSKVYGDLEWIPLAEGPKRFTSTLQGVSESCFRDCTLRSLFGASKLSADIMVQEYGRYYGMRTVCFRCGCLTGPDHSGVEQHGFLSFLVKCVVHGLPYTVLGYRGKQVRDNLHSRDLVTAFLAWLKRPGVGDVYNLGGGLYSSCSVLEAIEAVETLIGKRLDWKYENKSRRGDHRWYVTDFSKFTEAYGWHPTTPLKTTFVEMIDRAKENV